MFAWLASACAVAALLLACGRRQALRASDDTPFRPFTPQHKNRGTGAQRPQLSDKARLPDMALERIPSTLAQVAASRSGPPAEEASRVHSRGGLCLDCPPSGLVPAGDDDPPPGHTTRYSAEVRRFATYRDLYQPD
jgi:hypothetical protein